MSNKITKKELIEKLKELQEDDDTEVAHWKADMLLLEYIDDIEIREAFEAVNRWYA